MPTITTETTLNVMPCPACGILFAIPEIFEKARREDGGSFFCPGGHFMSFKPWAKEKLEEAQRQLTAARCAEADAKRALEKEREDRVKEAAKEKRRHASGKCPCCQRSFASLSRHIKHMHPDYHKQERRLHSRNSLQ